MEETTRFHDIKNDLCLNQFVVRILTYVRQNRLYMEKI